MKEMTEKEFVRIAISLNRLQRIHTVCAAHAISVSKKSSTKNRKSALLVYLKTQKLSKKNLNNREKKVLLKKKWGADKNWKRRKILNRSKISS